jgi:bisphosphoglycerate-dependent phosphoglycerate mutase
MPATTQKSDFNELLQDAALGFLQRHEAEYLGDDQVLFSRAVNVLTRSYGAAQAQAENAVARAYGELRNKGERRYLDISTSSGHSAVICDRDRGIVYTVPVAVICQRLIDSPERRRLRLVDHG